MNNIFVNFEIAQKLKNLDFKESCLGFYHNDCINPEVDLFSTGLLKLYSENKNITLVPTFEQVLNFLRTKYFINIKIEYLCSVNEILTSIGVIDFMINKFEKPDIHINSDSLDYYEVLTETILKCLNVIENKITKN
jgi:hypothetical protein